MLRHAALDQLAALKFHGMARALEEQLADPEIGELGFEERLALLVEREATERASRALTARLRRARLREQAAIEDIDWRARRGLDKRQVLHLASCGFLAEHLNILITGPAGVGKTYLACALAHKACREGYSALYLRLPRLFRELEVARGDGSYERLLKRFARTDLLVLDNWGLVPIGAAERRDLLEILEDRYGLRSTLVTSQLPVDAWHELIGNPTLADGILDRLVHGAYRLALDGESMRRRAARSALSPQEGGIESTMRLSEAAQATIAIRAGVQGPPKSGATEPCLAAERTPTPADGCGLPPFPPSRPQPPAAPPPTLRLRLWNLRTASHTPSRPQIRQTPPTTTASTISTTLATPERRTRALRKRSPTTGDHPRVASLRLPIGFNRNSRSISAESGKARGS